MTLIIPQCIFCKLYRRGGEGPTCTAFPDGIPKAILTNQHDHRKAYPGDNGVRFDPVDADAAEIVDALFRQPRGDDAKP